MPRLLLAALTLLAAVSCSKPDCGPGSHVDGDRCVGDFNASSVCAPGTHLSGTSCQPDFQCGAGTKAQDGLCVADPSAGTGPTIWGANTMVVDTWCAEPAIAVDSQGNVFVVCMTESYVAIFKSTDQGGSFTELARYAPSAGTDFNGDVTVAVDKSDRVFFAWIDYTYAADGSMSGAVQAVVFQPGGTNGSTPQKVSVDDPLNPFNDRPWLNLAWDGSMYLSYIHGKETQTVSNAGAQYAVSTDGGPFGTPVTFRVVPRDGDYMVTSPIAFTANGKPCTVEQYWQWGGAGELVSGLRSIYPNGAQAWSTGDVIDSLDQFPHFSFDPYASITSDSQGRVTVAYVNAPSRKPTLYLSRSTDGAHWSTPIAPNFDWLGDQHFPWVTVDENDGLHVLFLDNRGGQWQAYTLSSKDGEAFGPIQRVTDAPFDENGSQQTWIGDFNGLVARAGKLYAVWTDLRTGSSRTRVAVANNPLQ